MTALNERLIAAIRGKRIFIVEDKLENRVVFQMIFMKYGGIVTFERWGKNTLPNLRAMGPVDLILLDLMLPQGVSGFDVFDQIRGLPRYDQVPIVAVSAMDPAVAMPQAQAKGFSGFIAKPIDADRFTEQIASILSGDRVWYAGHGSSIYASK
jgi:CheY-like chemotaxis protein